ncbi:aldehyde dehydrogenase [Facklamia sp. DSM 111018]|uniref:Aldehyde dehydrogenase n=1 Tax=Facklamia lactis TaxID=2749967 RepID=A0ABS0LQA4_9LACT|nr:aldehyde dehydrogenase [Facklamia lactis]MBG9986132.1 aldehyde dehydrogenase [Facklamia lactis]
MTNIRQVYNWINGEYVPASNGETFDVTTPISQELIAEVSESTQEDADRAVAAAREAFDNGPWGKLTVKERSDKLRRMAEIIIERAEEIGTLDAMDVGKPIRNTVQGGEVDRSANNISFFADYAEMMHGEAFPMGKDYINYTTYDPVGVSVLITPWNIPFMLTTWKLGPALAAGNTVVIKPPEVTPLSVALLGEIAKEAGIPDGVVNIVHGKGGVVGNALTSHEAVDLVSFTGSTKTGTIIQQSAANTQKKVSVELGGKAADIIFSDADLKKAVPGAIRAAYTNTGQVCLAGSRLLVQEDILDAFLEAFVAEAKAFKVGDPNDVDTDMGPIVSEDQFQKVSSYIDWAKDNGLEILAGGKRPDNLPEEISEGYYLEPTIILAPDPNSKINQEEIFGPVVSVIPFQTEEEAIKIVNNSIYGLDGVIWTENLAKAHRVAHEIKAGTIWINDWFVRDLRVPFGGAKQSGNGREGGRFSMEFFTEAKNICIRIKD